MADRPWPPALRFSDALFQIVNTSRSGGPSISGQEQVVVSPTGRWKASVTIPIADRRQGEYQDQVLAYRNLIRGGRSATILVPTQDGRGPAHRAGIVPCRYGVPHSDGALFSDSSGYGQGFTNGGLVSNVSMNATQFEIRMEAGLELLPGMRFSTPDGRLHEVDDIRYTDGAGIWGITVLPWLRADYVAGTLLEFDRPVCRMRPATDDTGALALRMNRFATPSIEFVEAF